jgi:chromosome partitioning protein
MILVCGGSKGGSGKTTVCTNLAILCASEGRDVLMVDADEQESSTIFRAIRRKEHPESPQYTSVVLREDRVRTEVTALRSKFDDVIIDTGGRDSRS